MIGDYKDTLQFIPKDGQLIANININSFFVRRGIYGELDSLKTEPKIKLFLNNLEDLACAIAFSRFPPGDIDYRTDFFPYIKPNFTISFYELEGLLSNLISAGNTGKIKENLQKVMVLKNTVPFIIVFNIEDKDGIDDFLSKLNDSESFEKEIYREKEILYGKDKSYYVNDDFFIVASNSDLLKKSLDCFDNIEHSISKDINFSSFREKKMTSDSIGFLFCNVPSINRSFLDSMSEAKKIKWQELLECIKYTGCALDIAGGKLKLNSYLVKQKKLSPFAEKVFSLHGRKLRSVAFFPEKKSDLVAIAEPQQTLPILLSLFDGLTVITNLKNTVENQSGLTLDYIISSLSEEIACSLIPEAIEENGRNSALKKIPSGTIALKLKPNSSLNTMLSSSESLLSFIPLLSSESYRDISVRTVPGGTANYCRLNDFIMLFVGNRSASRDVINTFYKDNKSVEECIKSEISTEAIIVLYLNTSEIYMNYVSPVITDISLQEKLAETFEKYPELWGNVTSLEDGYLCKFIIPF
jgi:hypothetical protein